VLVYAVVTEETEKAVGLFVRRERAEQFLEAVRADEPELAERLRLEPVELDARSP
jgi:Tic22-like family